MAVLERKLSWVAAKAVRYESHNGGPPELEPHEETNASIARKQRPEDQ